jgi:hypothetical protein
MSAFGLTATRESDRPDRHPGSAAHGGRRSFHFNGATRNQHLAGEGLAFELTGRLHHSDK